MVDISKVRAIDIHTHAEEPCGCHPDDGYDELQSTMAKYFGAPWQHPPTISETAAHFREKNVAAVIFPVDAERETGYRRYKNEEVAQLAAENSDILIPFASIDPHKGKLGAREARRLVKEFGVQGFKFHPTMQGFFPNDRLAYPLYEAIQETGKPALFHTGQTGVGSGMRAGNNMRLKYSNPMHLDDVAVDFPDMTIIMAHPSFPWQEEALAVANHKPNVYIDLSGWSPKYFPKNSRPVLQHASQEEGAVRFRLADDQSGALVVRLREDRDQGRGAPAHSQRERGATSQARVTTVGAQLAQKPQTGHPEAGDSRPFVIWAVPAKLREDESERHVASIRRRGTKTTT